MPAQRQAITRPLAIAGATRLAVSLTGMAGHAGTVPMALRRDALAGAAECIAAIAQANVDKVGTTLTGPNDPRLAQLDEAQRLVTAAQYTKAMVDYYMCLALPANEEREREREIAWRVWRHPSISPYRVFASIACWGLLRRRPTREWAAFLDPAHRQPGPDGYSPALPFCVALAVPLQQRPQDLLGTSLEVLGCRAL